MEVKRAAEWYVERLLGRRMARNLSVTIRNRVGFDEDSRIADCEAVEVGRNPRDFVIQVRSDLTRVCYLRALAHELTHVKQLVRNEFRDMHGSVWYWKGDLIDEQDVSYRDLPWEVEAYDSQKKLYKEYRLYRRKNGLT
jgi:hypothetical protein